MGKQAGRWEIGKVVKMRCVKCYSPRTVRFLDGFGEKRIFCRACHDSSLTNATIPQKRILDFGAYQREVIL